MPTKKKRAGHTDYRTGGMFYPKYNEGGVNVNAGGVDVAAFKRRKAHAERVLADEQKLKDKSSEIKSLTGGRTFPELTRSEKANILRRYNIPVNYKKAVTMPEGRYSLSSEDRQSFKNTRFDPAKYTIRLPDKQSHNR